MTPPGAGASAPYFDPRVRAWVLGVLPGRRAVVADPDLALTTLLGSCVAACLRDPERRVGGMNHFLLPGGGGSAARLFVATPLGRATILREKDMIFAALTDMGKACP